MRWLLCIAALFLFAICRAEPVKISQDVVSDKTYYHLLFTLTPSNSSFTIPSSYTNKYSRMERPAVFDDDFEVYIKASDFPVPSPGCNGGWIILRMTATDTRDPYSDEKIEAKKQLWDRLQKMYETSAGFVDVVIELNPYVHVIDASVPKLELEYCNVFFRQAHGEYIPYVGALTRTNNFPDEKLPTTWPATDEGGWSQGTNSDMPLHWFKRASQKCLGTQEDITEIKTMILGNLKGYDNPSVGEIRWLSPTLIIADAGWYTGPLGAGSFLYILEKKGTDWKIIQHYLMGIS